MLCGVSHSAFLPSLLFPFLVLFPSNSRNQALYISQLVIPPIQTAGAGREVKAFVSSTWLILNEYGNMREFESHVQHLFLPFLFFAPAIYILLSKRVSFFA